MGNEWLEHSEFKTLDLQSNPLPGTEYFPKYDELYNFNIINILVDVVGFEPTTYRLWGDLSTNWAKRP